MQVMWWMPVIMSGYGQSLLSAALGRRDDDLEVRRPRIGPTQQALGQALNDWFRVVLARELLDRVEVVEDRHGHELDFVAVIAAQHVGAAIALDAMDAGQHVGVEHVLIRVRIFARSPSVPDSTNHLKCAPRTV